MRGETKYKKIKKKKKKKEKKIHCDNKSQTSLSRRPRQNTEQNRPEQKDWVSSVLGLVTYEFYVSVYLIFIVYTHRWRRARIDSINSSVQKEDKCVKRFYFLLQRIWGLMPYGNNTKLLCLSLSLSFRHTCVVAYQIRCDKIRKASKHLRSLYCLHLVQIPMLFALWLDWYD